MSGSIRTVVIVAALLSMHAGPAAAQLPGPYPPPPEPSTSFGCLAMAGAPCQFTASHGGSPYVPYLNPFYPDAGIVWIRVHQSGVYGFATNVNIHTDGPVTWAPGEGGGQCPLDYHLDIATGYHRVQFCVGDVYTVTVDAGAVFVGTAT